MARKPRARAAREPHDEDVVTAALTELALVGGSATRAEQRLKEKGIDVARITLERWRDDTRADQYAQVRDEMASTVQKRIAGEHESVALAAADVTRKMLARLDKEVEEVPIRDLAGAARNVGTIAGISTDKALSARERPVAMPPATRSFEELCASLVAMKVATMIGPGEPAIDVSDAEVIEESGQ